MKPRPVLQHPNELLRVPALPVKEYGTAALRALVAEMVETMRRLNGIGLAATQLGIAQQIAIIELKDGPLVLINPTIHKPSRKLETDEEGCLSVSGIFGEVPRSASLTLKAKDIDGHAYEAKAQGLFARVIQHEVDHLHGKLFIDRCTKLTTGLEKARRLGLIT